VTTVTTKHQTVDLDDGQPDAQSPRRRPAEHFFQQFSGPMTARWKTLGSPVLTPEVQKKLIDSEGFRRRRGRALSAMPHAVIYRSHG